MPLPQRLVRRAPGAPLQGPPQRPLPQLRLEIRGDDIFVVPSMHDEHIA